MKMASAQLFKFEHYPLFKKSVAYIILKLKSNRFLTGANYVSLHIEFKEGRIVLVHNPIFPDKEDELTYEFIESNKEVVLDYLLHKCPQTRLRLLFLKREVI